MRGPIASCSSSRSSRSATAASSAPAPFFLDPRRLPFPARDLRSCSSSPLVLTASFGALDASAGFPAAVELGLPLVGSAASLPAVNAHEWCSTHSHCACRACVDGHSAGQVARLVEEFMCAEGKPRNRRQATWSSDCRQDDDAR